MLSIVVGFHGRSPDAREILAVYDHMCISSKLSDLRCFYDICH